MKALTIQAHMAAWERKTRRFGASPQQTSNFIQALQSDLDSAEDQKGKMKQLVVEALKDMVGAKNEDSPADSKDTQIIEQSNLITELKQKIADNAK